MTRTDRTRPQGGHPAGRTVGRRARRTTLTGRAAVLALVLGALVLTLALPVREWFAQRGEIAALRAGVASAEADVGALTVELDRWRDPAYLAAQARSRLHLVFPGEVGYVVIDDAGPGAAEVPGARQPEPPPATVVPWYARLWAGVQQADRR